MVFKVFLKMFWRGIKNIMSFLRIKNFKGKRENECVCVCRGRGVRILVGCIRIIFFNIY